MTTDSAAFSGFRPEAIQFLADLAEHNDRAWFQPRKADYELLLKEPMEALVVAMAERFAARGIPLLADPKRSPFRIYRDTRFSRDKSPYKTHLAASFAWAGSGRGGGEATAENPHSGGGYFNFEPGEMYVGGGLWMPDKSRVEEFRRAIVDEPGRVKAALEEPGFVAWFGAARSHDTLKRIPPGWPQEHPMADLFRWKDVVFGRRLSDEEVCSADLPDRLAEGYAAALPVFRFLETLR
jgi:uncharacterized protein (TIGR02453 family)